jgi:hypothetical protein
MLSWSGLPLEEMEPPRDILHINKGCYKASNHSRIVVSCRQALMPDVWLAMGLALSMASRFISRSTVAYRLVVLTLACPSH